MVDEAPRVARALLEDFSARVFERLGLEAEDARVSAEVLVAADALGLPSHGLARLARYVAGLETGLILPRAEVLTLADTPTSLVLDAQGGMGAPVSLRAMRAVIDKAASSGLAFACVRDSNHFGIAGYYARLALERDMIGLAMTNTAALGVPSFGRRAMFGTNPLAFAAPAGVEKAFVLDMSTTVVSRGTIEVVERAGGLLPEGWAVDRAGRDATAPAPLLRDLQSRAGGGILPLGGRGKDLGGHKGYGLAVMVDILCAVLGGSAYGPALFDRPGSSARVSHFFGAIKIANFREPADFRRDMDAMLRDLRDSPPSEGEARVLYAGLPEAENEAESARLGVPVAAATLDSLRALGDRFDLEFAFTQ